MHTPSECIAVRLPLKSRALDRDSPYRFVFRSAKHVLLTPRIGSFVTEDIKTENICPPKCLLPPLLTLDMGSRTHDLGNMSPIPIPQLFHTLDDFGGSEGRWVQSVSRHLAGSVATSGHQREGDSLAINSFVLTLEGA